MGFGETVNDGLTSATPGSPRTRSFKYRERSITDHQVAIRRRAIRRTAVIPAAKYKVNTGLLCISNRSTAIANAPDEGWF